MCVSSHYGAVKRESRLKDWGGGSNWYKFVDFSEGTQVSHCSCHRNLINSAAEENDNTQNRSVHA